MISETARTIAAYQRSTVPASVGGRPSTPATTATDSGPATAARRSARPAGRTRATRSAASVAKGPSGRTVIRMGAITAAAMATSVSPQMVSVTPMSAIQRRMMEGRWPMS